MQCQTGCSDCCHVRLTVTNVEAAAIRAHLAGRSITIGTDPDRCAALDPAGRCQIYDARPVVCRSHGSRSGCASLAPRIRNCTATSPAASRPPTASSISRRSRRSCSPSTAPRDTTGHGSISPRCSPSDSVRAHDGRSRSAARSSALSQRLGLGVHQAPRRGLHDARLRDGRSRAAPPQARRLLSVRLRRRSDRARRDPRQGGEHPPAACSEFKNAAWFDSESGHPDYPPAGRGSAFPRPLLVPSHDDALRDPSASLEHGWDFVRKRRSAAVSASTRDRSSSRRFPSTVRPSTVRLSPVTLALSSTSSAELVTRWMPRGAGALEDRAAPVV